MGVDPVTGLPVLIYVFEGRPRVTVGRLEADTIPSILAARFNSEKNKGQVVVAHSEERQQVAQVANQDEARLLLLDTAKALATAASVKVVHGDIYPGRFWVEAGRYWLEGYGVNWRSQDERFSSPEQSVSLQGDVFSWAQSVYDLAGHALPRAMTKLVATCLADNPEQRPTAAALLEQLTNLAEDGSSSHQATETMPPSPATPDSAASQSAVSQSAAPEAAGFGETDFDLDFQDDDTATFADDRPDTNAASQTEAHAAIAKSTRMADFDLGSFADDDDEDTLSSSNTAGDYDFLSDDGSDDATADVTGVDKAGSLANFADADFGDVSGSADVDFGGSSFGDNDFGDNDFGDNDFGAEDDFADNALASRDSDDDALTADPFADDFSDDNSTAANGAANFDSFDDDDDLVEPSPSPAFSSDESSSTGLSDLSDIMSPANDPHVFDDATSQPIAKPDAGEFIKGLPTGATVRTVASKKKAPVQELPTGKQAAKVYTPPSKRKKRNLGRKVGLVALFAAAGVLLYLALDRYGVLDPPPPPGPVASFFPLTVSVRPTSIAQAQLVVVSSPEDSVHDAGDEMATVPARIFLDSEGTWQLQARFQDTLSEVQTLTVPGPNAVTFEIPIPEEDLEPPPDQ